MAKSTNGLISSMGKNNMVTIYPTGVTIYKPDKCWNGYTIYRGGNVIDMNGSLVKRWEEISQLGKILPGGYVLGDVRCGGPRRERGRRLIQMDWEGNIIWEFRKTEQIKVGDEAIWSAKQHHDFQREGNPVGYYAPHMEPSVEGGKTLILASKEVENKDIAPGKLLDDCILEVTWDVEIVWEWRSCKHFNQMGFSEAARNTIYRQGSKQDPFDWLHSNSISYLGPNKWHDKGDKRFHPDNIIWDGRNTNTIAIIDKKTHDFVWRVGPDYTDSPELRKLGQIVGQHHAHMIPRGLPGEGNILVFDNGGFAGYGLPNPSSPTGVNNAVRPYSRVIEFNPNTLEVCWEYSADRRHHFRFYSPYISSAQRLPNGNTLICEGNRGRIFEVTRDLEIVWEYVVPPSRTSGDSDYWGGIVPPSQKGYWGGISYRAYRVPYNWIPQLDEPVEKAVIPPNPLEFRIKP